MSRTGLPPTSVGKEFIAPPAKLQPAAVSVPKQALPVLVGHVAPKPAWSWTHFVDSLHRHSLLTFAVLLLLIGVASIQLGSRYLTARALSQIKPAPTLKSKARVIAGLNLTIPSEELEARLQTITHQPSSLTVGDKTASISSETIKSWLQITSNTAKSEYYVHIKADTIGKSLTDLANKYAKTPRDQVTVTHGGVSQVVVAGVNGARLNDPSTLNTQAAAIAKTLMDAKGLQFSTPLETVPFQALTPAAFNKLIEVNVITKQMYLYDSGQITRSYPISAGAPSTPTLLGQYKIYSKFRIQDMKGFNPDGSKYFQPNVRWINYFAPGGYAVHGNYWRPTSWFGAINSSHGCVSLPEDQAKEVFDWAPIGTTVINHA